MLRTLTKTARFHKECYNGLKAALFNGPVIQTTPDWWEYATVGERPIVEAFDIKETVKIDFFFASQPEHESCFTEEFDLKQFKAFLQRKGYANIYLVKGNQITSELDWEGILNSVSAKQITDFLNENLR